MSNSHKYPKSKFEWFRMVVLKRHRDRVSKTTWKQSLGTTDPQLAKIRRAELSAYYLFEVKRLDDELAGDAVASACFGR